MVGNVGRTTNKGVRTVARSHKTCEWAPVSVPRRGCCTYSTRSCHLTRLLHNGRPLSSIRESAGTQHRHLQKTGKNSQHPNGQCPGRRTNKQWDANKNCSCHRRLTPDKLNTADFLGRNATRTTRTRRLAAHHQGQKMHAPSPGEMTALSHFTRQ